MAIHDYYDRITDDQRDVIDEAMQIFMDLLTEKDMIAPCDDRAEHVVEAMAKYVYAGNLS